MSEQQESTYYSRYRERLIATALGVTGSGHVTVASRDGAIHLVDRYLDAKLARAAASQENLRQRLAAEAGAVALSEVLPVPDQEV